MGLKQKKMSYANVVFVDLNSANVSSLTWPLGSNTMYYQENNTLAAENNGFFVTNSVNQVLNSATALGFWGRTTPNSTSYSVAWQSTFNSVTNQYSFQSVSANTTVLGDLQLYNQRSQLFLASTSPTSVTFKDISSVGQAIVNILNGPTSVKNENYPSFSCPCQNASNDAWCSLGAWNFIAQQINLTLTNKVQSFMAPCMNPGNTMFVNEGVGSIFNVTAQIKRIRNLDRIQFRTVQATPKPCNQSVLFSFAAVTCGQTVKDECPSFQATTFTSCSSAVDTRLGLDFSIQATILGTNVLDSSRLCDNLAPIGQGIHCPLQNNQCLEVYLPLMLVNMTVEVPVVYASSTAWDSFCKTVSGNTFTKAYYPRFNQASISMSLALSEKPVILYPTNTVLIPEQYKTFIETTVMDAANTVLKNSLDEQLTNAFSPFFQDSFVLAPLLDALPQCVNFSQTQIFMACPTTEIVVPPTQCDPCDFCCICYTGGDCGEKCRQECGCVNTFCTAVDRIAYPIWWKIVLILTILLVILIILIGGFMRGINR